MARHVSARSPGAASVLPLTLATRRPTGVRVGVGALLVLLLGGLVTAVVVSLLGASGQARPLPPEASARVEEAAGGALYVHILGAVGSPGVYQFRDGDRVVDAIAAAGGFAPAADQQAVNLARFLSDGEQILVPVQGAAPPVAGPTASDPSAKVNLNTASSSELETLPRIGPATAERIIAWRETNGRFGAVDDLLNVPGIGDKTFESLKDLVTV
ncbi:helix-hairpin-helix domain-containing protein [Mycetocola sp. 2940]|uniref:helix-hairpin-helix domain-containing protein n=1 Tax=Mycetocola sp. 2940 TaxID=3156452 RepID=UPI003392F12C